ncbi:TetR-like C-terminal domain-containing protein [Embleya sp. NPDC020630]|uniref:TetR-like C-terminal domain-containing protein n=1 Tax=Embleya sp. NPDC020630 TaxID=3363979 RepID=UPI0037B349A2
MPRRPVRGLLALPLGDRPALRRTRRRVHVLDQRGRSGTGRCARRRRPAHRRGGAYIAWALEHPGAYQLLFESDDQLPATRADHGPRLQRRIVELAHRVDPQTPFAAALLLWSAWHGVVSLRPHKTEWDWGMAPHEANRRLVPALTTRHSSHESSAENGSQHHAP